MKTKRSGQWLSGAVLGCWGLGVGLLGCEVSVPTGVPVRLSAGEAGGHVGSGPSVSRIGLFPGAGHDPSLSVGFVGMLTLVLLGSVWSQKRFAAASVQTDPLR